MKLRVPPATRFGLFTGLAVGIVLFLLVLSLSRPAQRYLLFVVPLFYVLLLPDAKGRYSLISAAILLSVIFDLYIALNQAASGIASAEMTRRIADLGLLSETSPGAIESHVGNLFFRYRNNDKHFVVVAGDRGDKLASVHYSVFQSVPFIGKTYSLVPLQQPQRF
jgi:hypothetical protein